MAEETSGTGPGRALVPHDAARFRRDRGRVEAGFWDKVRRTLGRVPFVEPAVAAYFCAADRQTPVQVRAVIMGALAYFVIPADLIPDFIAALGFSDDATVFYVAYQTVSKHITERHRARAREAVARLRGTPTGADPD